jgi:hypothetical protein
MTGPRVRARQLPAKALRPTASTQCLLRSLISNLTILARRSQELPARLVSLRSELYLSFATFVPSVEGRFMGSVPKLTRDSCKRRLSTSPVCWAPYRFGVGGT